MNEEGVSELLGYAILAGLTMTAVICVASGAAGMISASAGSAGFREAILSIGSLASAALGVAHDNNTYFTTSEVLVPPAYELVATGADDDAVRVTIACGSGELYRARLGCVRLRSPFRSVAFEGGAVFANDSGVVEIARRPSVFVAGREGDNALYVYLIGVSADPAIVSGGSASVVKLKAESHESTRVTVQPTDTITISIWSRTPEGWSAALREKGFAVTCVGHAVTATTGGISDVCVDRAALRLEIE